MTCKEFLEQLDELIDGELSGELRAHLEEHMKRCGHCHVTFDTTRKTIQIYRSHELYELPDSLRQRLQKAIMSKCKKGCGDK